MVSYKDKIKAVVKHRKAKYKSHKWNEDKRYFEVKVELVIKIDKRDLETTYDSILCI